ncbi:hypothetical protein L204_103907 [Cryptococcus depauperatus]|nr:alpha-aminoadipic semialdehyde synthase [Cryptococcus depauperatus CBS 7855]
MIRLGKKVSLVKRLYRNLTTLGVRREDPKRIWERRAPLTPAAVERLLTDGKAELQVQVESCRRRCFTDKEYLDAGAKIVPTLTKDVDIVLGIKEPALPSVDTLLEASKLEEKKRTWMMFSHTHKGQEYNTPLLSSFLHPTQTLIDHELLTAPVYDDDGKVQLKRVAAFGWYAGAVGAGEGLSLTGLALLKRGISSPLLHLARPYAFGTLAAFKEALRKTGDQIRSLPAVDGDEPIVIGLTGAGNVSTGARDMLEELGVMWIEPNKLAEVRQHGASNQIYACAVTPQSYLHRLEGGNFNKSDYYKFPAKYESQFSQKIAPYITTLINGVGWNEGFPRTISNSGLTSLVERENGKQKLVAVQDISCDKEGGLEFVNQYTTIDNPLFEGPSGILISSIDILPTELAMDASEYFSSKLYPYVHRIVLPEHSKGDKAGEIATLERAAIVKNGQLQPGYEWLGEKVQAWKANMKAAPQEINSSRRDSRKKKILLLGSGLVAGPAVDVLAARPDVELAIASNNLAEARSHIKNRTNIQAVLLDIADENRLSQIVASSDVVVSLLPAPMHPTIAQHCLTHKKHLVTASYVSPEMKSLHQSAIDKDVLFLGECGLDPGIDSMAAMRILDKASREGKKVTSFISWCGGLPELSASNVPLRYKFSWSPKAVLTASGNDARFKLDGKETTISGSQLLSKHFSDVNLWDDLPLEGLANRDAIPYAEKYGLGPVADLTNLFRGTLRYQGFSSLLETFRKLGLLRQDSLSRMPVSWQEFLRIVIEREMGLDKGLKERDVTLAIRDLIGNSEETLHALRWLSLLPNESLAPALPDFKTPSPVDLFAHLLSSKLAYAPGERDTCLLHHSFSFSDPTASAIQKVTASLKHIATPEHSSMSITVGKTLAFAVLRVADGKVKGRGVTGPYERDVWEGVLGSLEGEGVIVEEKWD